MKEMVKRMREEKGGFTIAELLIVVAIIAVLVAIAIPVFTAQLDKANAGTDVANARSAYGIASTLAMNGSDSDNGEYCYTTDGKLVKADDLGSSTAYVSKGSSTKVGDGEAVPSYLKAWEKGQTMKVTISNAGKSGGTAEITWDTPSQG